MSPPADRTGPGQERQVRRYPFAVPLTMELSNGLFRPADSVPAVLVDLSKFGAALVMAADPRLKVRRRYRVEIDDHAGIVEIRNIAGIEPGMLPMTEVPSDAVRVGVVFKSLGLELQELVADSVAHAQTRTSRLVNEPTGPNDNDPFGDQRGSVNR